VLGTYVSNMAFEASILLAKSEIRAAQQTTTSVHAVDLSDFSRVSRNASASQDPTRRLGGNIAYGTC
jgi:hypothetical protein